MSPTQAERDAAREIAEAIYSLDTAAQLARAGHRRDAAAVARAAVQHLTPEEGKATPCTACRRSVVYVRPLDRFVHTDGTDNRECWPLTQGPIYPPTEEAR
jgi:hypothetical protein